MRLKSQFIHLLIAVLSQQVHRLFGISHDLALSEGDVKTGRVIVDELKEEHLEGEAVLILSLGARKLCWRVNGEEREGCCY